MPREVVGGFISYLGALAFMLQFVTYFTLTRTVMGTILFLFGLGMVFYGDAQLVEARTDFGKF